MIITSILVLALILRLVSLNQSFWLDEAIGVLAAKFSSWGGLLTQFPKGDNHPPLYYLMLKGWGDTFGYSEVAVRILSVAFGVLTVFFVFKIAQHFAKGKKISKYFSLLVGALMATSPLHIYYSQEARMYIVASALAAGAVYFFLKTLDKVRTWYWAGFSVAIAALVFTDYLPVFLLPVFWIYGAIKARNKKWWIYFGLSHLPLLALGLAWLPIFQIQSQAGKIFLATLPAWKDLAGGATFKQLVLVWNKFILGRITFFDKTFYYLLLGVCSLPFLIGFYQAVKKIKNGLFFWLWLSAPLVLGFLASFVIPAFNYFRFIFVLPAFYLVLALGIVSIKNKWGYWLGGILIVINLLGWGLYAFNPIQHRENWRGAVAFVEKIAIPDSVIIFANPEPFAPYRWYASGDIPAFGILGNVKINEAEAINRTDVVTHGKTGVIYFSYLQSLMDPGNVIVKTILKLGFHAHAEYSYFPGVGKITYFAR